MIIDLLLKNLQVIYPDFEERLNPGVDVLTLEKLQQQLAVTFPDVWKELYQRFDGEHIGLAFGWSFIPTERILTYFPSSGTSYEPAGNCYPDNPKLVKENADWSKRVPIIEDYGGSVIYMDFDPNYAGHYGQLILIFRDYPDTVFNVSSDLITFLELINEQFVRGNVEWEDDDYIEFNIKSGRPSYDFWMELSNSFRDTSILITDDVVLPELWRTMLVSANYDFIDHTFTVKDFHKIRYVFINQFELLNDINLLRLFPNLVEVDLYVDDFLSECLKLLQTTSVKKLETVATSETIEIISQIRSLKSLTISDCHSLNLLHPLATMIGLKSLSLRNGTGQSLEPLSSLENLTSLSLDTSSGFTTSNWTNWDTISKLSNLIRLDISNTNFHDLSLLKSLPLTYLNIANCLITDYTPLLNLPTGLYITSDFAFFEEAIVIAPHKRFAFNSIEGKGTDEQEEKWRMYMDSLQNN